MDQFAGAQGRILEYKSNIAKAAAYFGIVKQYLAPQLSIFLGRIPVAISEPKIANDKVGEARKDAGSKSSSHLVPDQRSFVLEGVFGAILSQLGPTWRRSRDDGE